MMERFGGSKNAGKLGILEEGMEIKSVSNSNEDAQYLQSRQFSVVEIARFFRVPAHLVGDATRLAYASSEVEMLAFLTHTLRPWLTNIESEFNAVLLPERTQFFCEFDINGMARGDQAARYAAYERGLASGFLTVADVRRWENLPAIEGTDGLRETKSVIQKRILRDAKGNMIGIEEAG
jgi:HK97 family phage portal protein